jgi:hypothetical protein
MKVMKVYIEEQMSKLSINQRQLFGAIFGFTNPNYSFGLSESKTSNQGLTKEVGQLAIPTSLLQLLISFFITNQNS